jgi:FG-GAP-like repeat
MFKNNWRPELPLTMSLIIFSGVANAVSFSSPTKYPVGVRPVAVATGDFNGDGDADIAVANSGSNDISILLSNEDGNFQQAISYNVGQSPVYMTVGDFNGDHNLDLAVIAGSAVSIFLGDGDGTFQSPLKYITGIAGAFVTSVDFNSDRKLDLLVSDNQRNIVVLLGNGDGTFRNGVLTTTPGTSSIVALADFNGDGIPDVATGNGEPRNGSQDTGSLVILIGKGDGSFQPAATYPVNFWPRAFVAGDFNGDGKMDLAATVAEGVFNDDIRVFWGNGDGTFNVSSPIKGEFATSVITSDLNQDGKLDLIGLEDADPVNIPVEIQLILSTGNGFQNAAFNPCQQSADCLQLSLYPSSFAAGDFNGDGLPDLVVSNLNDNSISVFLNTGTATGSPNFSLTTSAFTPSVISPGQSATATLKIVDLAGFGGRVSFMCSVQPLQSVTGSTPNCLVSPASSTSNATITVNTVALTGHKTSGEMTWGFYAMWLPFFTCIAATCGFGRSDKIRDILKLSLMCGTLSLALISQIGCAGGSQGNSPSESASSNGSTSPGSYTVTVTGQSGLIVHSLSLPLTVQ